MCKAGTSYGFELFSVHQKNEQIISQAVRHSLFYFYEFRNENDINANYRHSGKKKL